MNQVGLAIPSILLDSPDPNPDIWNLTETLWENTFRKWNEINLITDINFQHLDLFEDEQITLTQTIQDIRDIEKVFTDFSRTFNLPATSVNNKLFKHYYRRDLVSDAIPDGIFDANSKLDAILELNYKPFKAGYIVMNGVKLKNNVPESYNITFYGQTIQLKDRVQDRKLSSLDFSQFNHDYNVTRVKQGLESFVSVLNGQTVSVPHIIYPLISHTQRFIYDSTAGGVLTTQARSDTTRNLYASGSQADSGSGNTERLGTTKGFQFTDLKPALRIIDIIKVIEQDNEIDINFTDDFFKTTGFFSNLYMWLHRNKGEIGVTPTNETNTNLIVVDKIQSFTGDVIEFFDSDTTQDPPHSFTGIAPVFDGGVFRFATGLTSQTSFDDKESMKIKWTVTPSVNTKNFTARLRKAGTNEVIAELAHTSGTTNTILEFEFETSLATTVENHNVEFVIETTETSLNLTYGLTCTKILEQVGTGTQNLAIQAGTISPDSVVDTIYISDQIPDMKILNFLTGLFKTFNLTAFVDNDVSSSTFSQIKVQTLDSFYASGTTRDITEFVNIEEGESNFSVPFNDIGFSFEEPKSFAAFYYNKLNSREYGSVKASDASNSGRDPRLNRGQDYIIKTPYEKMLFERLKNVNGGADTNIGFGYFVDDNQSPTIGNPLLFYKKSTSVSGTPIQMFNGGGTGTPASISTINRATNFQEGTASVFLAVSGEPSSISFSYLDGNNAPQTVTVANGANTTINPVIKNSVIITSNVDDPGNVTITYTVSSDSQTLNFSREVNPFVTGQIDDNTLFKKYYSDYISDLFSYNRRLVKVKAILPQSFLLQYKLSDTLIISNEAFIINKITTNLQTGESSLELLNKL
jgi:hypothetical protein|tara:strand:- start:2334 stop:4919 length:2586 start_codon:yes stop_codon:yes gene_type:complete